MFFKANSNNFHHLPNKLASLHSYIINFFKWQSKTRLKMYWPKGVCGPRGKSKGNRDRNAKSNYQIKMSFFCGKLLLVKLLKLFSTLKACCFATFFAMFPNKSWESNNNSDIHYSRHEQYYWVRYWYWVILGCY